ncbi:hypothetical protein MTO96_050466 [Rhipicephalus appendiculatus]
MIEKTLQQQRARQYNRDVGVSSVSAVSTTLTSNIDLLWEVGRVGHKTDVCPDCSNKLCRGCGISNPAEDHGCVPKCGLYGCNHLTADKACEVRFQMAHVVRQRRWERRRVEQEDDAERRNRDKRGSPAQPDIGSLGS